MTNLREWIDLLVDCGNMLLEAPVVWTEVSDPRRDTMVPVWSLSGPADLGYALRHTASKGELRGLLSDDLLLAWDSYKEVHGGVQDELRSYDNDYGDSDDFQPLDREWKALIYLYKDHVAMAPKRDGNRKYVMSHPIIQAIYRGTPILGAVRSGTN